MGARLDDARARFISKKLLSIKGVLAVSVSPARREVVVKVKGLEPERVRQALEECGFPPEPERVSLFSERVGSWRWARVLKVLRGKVLDMRANPLTGFIFLKFDDNERQAEEVLKLLEDLEPEPVGSESLLRDRLAGRLKRQLVLGLLGVILGLGAWAGLLLGRLNLSATLGLLGALVLGRELLKLRNWWGLSLTFAALGLSFWERFGGGPGFFHLVSGALGAAFLLEACLTKHRLTFLKAVWELQKALPKRARVLRKEGVEDCEAQELEPGEKVLVRPGEPVPADGVDQEGRWRRQGEKGEGFTLTVIHPYPLGYKVRLLLSLEEALSSGAHGFSPRLLGNLLGLVVGACAAALSPAGFALVLLPWGRALQALFNLPRARMALKGFKRGFILKPRKLRDWAWLRSVVLPLGSALGPYGAQLSPEAARLIAGLAGKISSRFPEAARGRVLYPEEGVEAEGWKFGYIRFVGLKGFSEHTLLFPVFLKGPDGRVEAIRFRRELKEGVKEVLRKFKRRYLLTSAPRSVADAWAKALGGFTGCFPEASPQGKLHAVRELELRGKRVLYFDDEPHRYDILRAARLGVALAGDFLPLEADAVALDGSVRKALLPRTMAKRSLGSTGFRFTLWLLAIGSVAASFLSPEAALGAALGLSVLALS